MRERVLDLKSISLNLDPKLLQEVQLRGGTLKCGANFPRES